MKISSSPLAGSPVHLAVDLGASSGRVMAGGLCDGKLQLEAVHRFPNDPLSVGGTMQWNLLELWNQIQQGMTKAASRYSDIQSIGVDSWGVDYGLLTSANSLAGPVHHYRDARTEGVMEQAFKIVPREEIFSATGLQFMPINTLMQMVAAKGLGDPSVSIAEDFLMIGDLVHWFMTGVRSVEVTNASTSQMLDARTHTWHSELIERFGLPRSIFGDLVQPGTQLGTLLPEVGKQTGLGNLPVVVPATHDTASAVIAVPADSFAPSHPDWCYISCGTWSLMGCELDHPKLDPACLELNFTNEGGVDGSTRLLKNIGGLWIFQQIRASMLRRGVERSWEEMVEMASQAEAFSCLIDPDDPAFAAPSDMVKAIETRAPQTGQSPPQGEGPIYRSALEGLALRYRVCLGMLESLVGNRMETIHMVGGGSANGLLCQMTADACARTVVAGPIEATAIGNVVMQMKGTGMKGAERKDTGTIDSIPAARKLIRESFHTQTYSPRNPEHWVGAAERFMSLSS